MKEINIVIPYDNKGLQMNSKKGVPEMNEAIRQAGEKMIELFEKTFDNCNFYKEQGNEYSLVNEIGVLRGIVYCMETIGLTPSANTMGEFRKMIEVQQELRERDKQQ